VEDDGFCQNNLAMVEIVVCQDEVREMKVRVSQNANKILEVVGSRDAEVVSRLKTRDTCKQASMQ